VDVIVKGRGARITDQVRRAAEHKLAKLSRLDPRMTRVEVEVIDEGNPRVDGGHRVEVACSSARTVFRARGAGPDIESALDQVVRRLERQITTHRGKLRDRRHGGPHRLESRRTSPEGSGTSE
jgi:ribosomal subunit interface protein